MELNPHKDPAPSTHRQKTEEHFIFLNLDLLIARSNKNRQAAIVDDMPHRNSNLTRLHVLCMSNYTDVKQENCRINTGSRGLRGRTFLRIYR